MDTSAGKYRQWPRSVAEAPQPSKPNWGTPKITVDCRESVSSSLQARLAARIEALSPARSFLGLEWPREVILAQRRSLIAGGLGPILDVFTERSPIHQHDVQTSVRMKYEKSSKIARRQTTPRRPADKASQG
jgi:hypothetical protein